MYQTIVINYFSAFSNLAMDGFMEGIFVNARLDIIADQKMWNSMALWLKVKQKQIFFTLLLLTLL